MGVSWIYYSNILRRILLPIQQDLTLFVISILLLGGLDVFYHQYIFHENTIGGMLLSYGEMIMLAYLICLCSYWLRKIHLKVVFYLILFVIYAVNYYLRLAYSTDFSPKILLLLLETNNKEISGFSLPMHSSAIAITLMVILSIGYSLTPAVLWPCVPKIIPLKYLGIAYSMIFFIQNFGRAIIPMFVGRANEMFYVNHRKGYDLQLPNINK